MSAEKSVPTGTTCLRVLIIDDEVAIARVLGLVLSEHSVVVTHSCRAAREAIESQEFDVILCDLSLPDGSGADVYAHLSERRPGHEARLGFLSGGGFNERTRNFMNEVNNPRLDKPFAVAEVKRLVAEIIENAKLTNPSQASEGQLGA